MGKMCNININTDSNYLLRFIMYNNQPCSQMRALEDSGGRQECETKHYHLAMKSFANHFHARAASRLPFQSYSIPSYYTSWRDSQWLCSLLFSLWTFSHQWARGSTLSVPHHMWTWVVRPVQAESTSNSGCCQVLRVYLEVSESRC